MADWRTWLWRCLLQSGSWLLQGWTPRLYIYIPVEHVIYRLNLSPDLTRLCFDQMLPISVIYYTMPCLPARLPARCQGSLACSKLATNIAFRLPIKSSLLPFIFFRKGYGQKIAGKSNENIVRNCYDSALEQMEARKFHANFSEKLVSLAASRGGKYYTGKLTKSFRSVGREGRVG